MPVVHICVYDSCSSLILLLYTVPEFATCFLFHQVACCEMYNAEDVHPHTCLLWPSLRREVMNGANKDVEEAALSALTAVVHVLEVGLTTPASRAAAASLIQAALAGGSYFYFCFFSSQLSLLLFYIGIE